MLLPVRRIVTGHDANGRSIVVSDGVATNRVSNPLRPNRGLTNLWRMETMPPSNGAFVDPMEKSPIGLEPPPNGNVFRFFQIAPEKEEAHLSPEERQKRAAAVFATMGAPHARVDTSRHPGMHKTRSVDYIILLSGEVTLILDEGEVAMKPFDVVIQRGTNHAWANYGDVPALLCAVLIDAAEE
jgi:quercetin dioxygenase-like cupin family protein